MGARQSSPVTTIRKEIEARMYGPDARTPEAQAWEAAKLKEIEALQRPAARRPSGGGR
jgi:hypothetical protein